MTTPKILLLALLAASLMIPAAAKAQGFSISIGDRGYYNHGSRYWDGDNEMIWVGGHRSHGHWIHGHYVRGAHRHHGWHGGHHERHDDRGGDHDRNDHGDHDHDRG